MSVDNVWEPAQQHYHQLAALQSVAAVVGDQTAPGAVGLGGEVQSSQGGEVITKSGQGRRKRKVIRKSAGTAGLRKKQVK